MYENWAVSLTVKAVFTHCWIEELDHKTKEKLHVSSFDAAFLPNVFQVFEKLWAVFNAEKKLKCIQPSASCFNQNTKKWS